MILRASAFAAVSVLVFAGAANAAPAKCIGMNKELNALGGKIQTLQVQQADIKARGDAEAIARAEAEEALNEVRSGFAGKPVAELEAELVALEEQLTQTKVELDALNAEIGELGGAFHTKRAAFNKICAGG